MSQSKPYFYFILPYRKLQYPPIGPCFFPWQPKETICLQSLLIVSLSPTEQPTKWPNEPIFKPSNLLDPSFDPFETTETSYWFVLLSFSCNPTQFHCCCCCSLLLIVIWMVVPLLLYPTFVAPTAASSMWLSLVFLFVFSWLCFYLNLPSCCRFCLLLLVVEFVAWLHPL